jgi:hypothetical protein
MSFIDNVTSFSMMYTDALSIATYSWMINNQLELTNNLLILSYN